MMVYECLMLMLMLCKSSYARLTPEVLHNAHHFTLNAPRVYEDFFRALCRLKQPGQLLGVGCFFGDLLFYGGELSGGDDCCGMTTALDLALIGALEGGADGDDPTGARHF